MTPARLTEWRERLRLSKAEAARQTGTHVNSWSAWESGKTRIPAWLGYVLRAVCDGLPPYA
jgi:DNA-binding transcriptional regulator YiaG